MKKNIIKPSILAGFMELLPQEQKVFNDMVEKITGVYQDNGCQAIDTPIIEKSEVLLAKSGGETEKQVYRFEKGKNDMALRFDLTVPFARYTAQYYNELNFPFRRYQIGKVYRGERNQRGRYKEFYQCDVDVIGKDKLSIYNDAWVISLASKAFNAIGLTEYQFQISNRKILKGIFGELNIDNVNEVMILIDKYDKISRDEFSSSLEELVGQHNAKCISQIMDMDGKTQDVLEKLSNLDVKNEEYKSGIKELNTVCKTLNAMGVKDEEFIINLKIIRGLDYYTGTVFETLLLGNEKYGSICSGGRYDNLAENYTVNILPGVGISIGLTRLFFVLKDIGFVYQYRTKDKLDYLIIPIGDTVEYCIYIMSKMQQDGKKVTVYFEEESLKKKMNYANKLGVENVILIGEDEVKNGQILIKNMSTGEGKLYENSSIDRQNRLLINYLKNQ